MAKVIFLQNFWHEWIGVMILSAVLKKNGHKCDVLIGEKKGLVRLLRKYKPDVIAFSCMVTQYDWVCKTAKYIKEKGIGASIIVGGPHPTVSPEMIKEKGVDVICRGEGEYAMLEFVNAVENKEDITKIKNLWVKRGNEIYKNDVRPLIENLDELPYSDRTLYSKYKWFRGNKPYEIFLNSRGCPYNCSFCFNHCMNGIHKNKGGILRFRSPESCIDEIKRVREEFKINLVMFLDSDMNLNKKWLLSFLKSYRKEVNLPFSCNIRPNLLDEEIVEALSLSNCNSVRFGPESGNNWLRNSILNKQLTNEQIIDSVALFKKYKIPIVMYNILGLPGETLEMAWETIELNAKLKPDYRDFNVFIPLPKLELTNYALKKGILKEEDFIKLSKGFGKTFRTILRQKDAKKIDNLHKFSLIASKHPRLKGIINLLIKLPPNRLFDAIYVLTQVFDQKKRSGRGNLRLIGDIIKNYRAFT